MFSKITVIIITADMQCKSQLTPSVLLTNINTGISMKNIDDRFPNS